MVTVRHEDSKGPKIERGVWPVSPYGVIRRKPESKVAFRGYMSRRAANLETTQDGGGEEAR